MRYLLLISSLVGCITLHGQNKTLHNAANSIRVAAMSPKDFDTARINKLTSDIQSGIFPNRHSLLIIKNGVLVYEQYFSGKDQLWGRDLGVRQHGPDELHDVRSLTKSFVSACVGIAIKKGLIKSVDEKIFSFFPQYAHLATGERRNLTVHHLLTMTSGLKWNEQIPYDNKENSEMQMTASPDPIEYVLSREFEHPPGAKFKYNGGTTQVLAAIIEKVSGTTIHKFAEENLFRPLGITRHEWVKMPGREMFAAASGLRLTSRDLVKFALLYRSKGKWNNREIIPAAWVKSSFQRHARYDNEGDGYGYQFWIWSLNVDSMKVPTVAAVGNGDQRIFFDLSNDLIVITTAGNYNKWDIEMNALAIYKEVQTSLVNSAHK